MYLTNFWIPFTVRASRGTETHVALSVQCIYLFIYSPFVRLRVSLRAKLLPWYHRYVTRKGGAWSGWQRQETVWGIDPGSSG